MLVLPPSYFEDARGLFNPHEILLFPSHLDLELAKRRVRRVPFVLHPNHLGDLARQASDALAAEFPPVRFGDLNPARLKGDWEKISALAERAGTRRAPPRWSGRLDGAAIRMPADLVRAQVLAPPVEGYDEDLAAITRDYTRARAFRAAAGRYYDRANSGPDSEEEFEKALEEEAERVSFAVTLAARGLARRQLMRARSARGFLLADTRAASFSTLDRIAGPNEVEDAVIDLIIAREAFATDGIGFRLPPVPAETFQKLEVLEGHFNARRVRPHFIWKQLRSIGSQIGTALPEHIVRTIRRSDRMTIYSDFPLGLAILEGDSAPLATATPVTYRNLSPLTRQLQFSLQRDPIDYLGDGLRVLIVECVRPRGSLVHRVGSGTWSTVSEVLAATGNTAALVECDSVDEIGLAIKQHKPNVLIVSAHGAYDPHRNVTGLAIGDDTVSEFPLSIRLPPVVVLSSCHTAPRGLGAVSVADLLLRNGATAVLATLVPINVFRRGLTMTRLVIYMIEALQGRSGLRSFDDVAQWTLSSNAVVDICMSTRRLGAWFQSDKGEVLNSFMLQKGSSRLRRGHFYADSWTLLREIASERRDSEIVRALSVEYERIVVPETLFYFVIGRPDRVVFNDPRIAAASNGTRAT
ncbi:MAG: hypothetical protein HYS27_18235 [Deltaproteobacteria bacterium]|nr:hypothetical protein [Deltaproteobacteria bacterium]